MTGFRDYYAGCAGGIISQKFSIFGRCQLIFCSRHHQYGPSDRPEPLHHIEPVAGPKTSQRHFRVALSRLFLKTRQVFRLRGFGCDELADQRQVAGVILCQYFKDRRRNLEPGARVDQDSGLKKFRTIKIFSSRFRNAETLN